MFSTNTIFPLRTSRSARSLLILAALGLTLASLLVFSMYPIPSSLMGLSSAQIDLSRLALPFVPNQGQSDASVLFQVQRADGSVFFRANEIVISLPGTQTSALAPVHLSFEGANPAAVVSGADRLPGVTNYFIGNDPAQWRTNIPTFASIVYQELYPGVDLNYTGTDGLLKGTYTVYPGADPSSIAWRHAGVSNVQIDAATGNLLISAGTSGQATVLIEQAPVAWQIQQGERVPVDVRYAPRGDGSFGFALGAYNQALPLTIDPTLIFSTYAGGGDYDDAEGITVDAAGNIYVTGATSSTDFPSVVPLQASNNGWEDAYVLKLNPAGDTLLFSTYLGGSDDDASNDIALDSAGKIYLAGDTSSTDFPLMNAYQDHCAQTFGGCVGDAFLAVLNAAGDTLQYATYLGGTNPESIEALAVYSDTVYLAGTTFSANFPTLNPYQAALNGPSDAFVAVIDAAQSGAASLEYSTFLGGSQADYGTGIGVNSTGEIYVGGQTVSSDFPTASPYQAALGGSMDAFVTKMDAAGSGLLFSTYLGGSGKDYAYDLAVDQAGAAYLTGNTESSDFPVVGALQAVKAGASDAFVTKLASDGSVLAYSTFLGGSGADYGYQIAVALDGSAYVAGNTQSANFPIQDTLQVYAGDGDAFVAKLDAAGSAFGYNTFIGGTQSDHATSIALDNLGHAFVAGLTFSTDFPTVAAYDATYDAGGDIFIAKLDDAGEGLPTPIPAPGTDLTSSDKEASQHTLAPDEKLTYTINLRNSGTEAALVDVTDPVPAELAYIPSSASNGGEFNTFENVITWGPVNVPANGSVALTFQVEPAVEVTSAVVVTNTATISATGESFERSAWISLIPASVPNSELLGSLKYPSQLTLAPDENLTYTIFLHNSGTQAEVATVTDPLAVELQYIAASATGGGTYDAGTHTLTWSGIDIPAGSSVSLAYQVAQAEAVTMPEVVTNTATISTTSGIFNRSAVITLIPQSIPADITLPVLQDLTIGDTDVLASPDVTLHISATDDVSVNWMYLREWQIAPEPYPHWEVVQSSGWVPFATDYPWTLGAEGGVHFVGAWVADGEHNVSLFKRQALDFANLVMPGETLSQFGMIPYLVYYDAGVEVSALLTPSDGNVDLYVWYPDNFILPDQVSAHPGTAVEEVHFTTPADGVYVFLVHAPQASTFDLGITPGGGPAAWASAGLTIAPDAVSQGVSAGGADGFTQEPIFTEVGLDPLGSPTAQRPDGPYIIYAPFIGR